MTLLGLILTAVGGGDLLRVLLPRTCGTGPRLAALSLLLLTLLVTGKAALSLPWWLLTASVVPILLWLSALRIGPPLPMNALSSTSRRQSVLIILFLLLSGALTIAADAVARSPVHLPPAGPWEVPTLTLATGLTLFLIASANGLVRAALRQDAGSGGTAVPPVDPQLKGGRWIGPLERLTLTGLLAVGAYPVAAGLIAAKGIVRFPEIQADHENGNKAEYFLVGSFVSWTLAIAAAGLLHLALHSPSA